jgi:hypothetical protein
MVNSPVSSQVDSSGSLRCKFRGVEILFDVVVSLTVLWWVFGPKYNLISIPGFEQGIRLEDIFASIIWLIYFLSKCDGKNIDIVFGGRETKILIIFMIISSFGAIVLLNESISTLVFTARWIQYFLVGAIIVSQVQRHPVFFRRFAEGWIIVNSLWALFTITPTSRFSGLSGGPWEVSSVALFLALGLCFFYQLNFNHRSATTRQAIIIALVGLIVIAAEARIQLFAFFLVLLLLKNIRRVVLMVIPVSFLMLLFAVELDDLVESLRFNALKVDDVRLFLHSIFTEEFGRSFESMQQLFPETDVSLVARLMIWARFIQDWYVNLPYSFLFGIGPGSGGVVVDGFYIRLFTEFGIFGAFVFFGAVRSWSKHAPSQFRFMLLSVLGIISITNDPITSQRIFTSLLISISIMSAVSKTSNFKAP